MSTLVISGSGIKLPEPEKIILDNGMTIYYLHDNSLPVVSFQFMMVGAGTAYEPAGIEGISDFTAEMLLRGNSAMTADEIAGELDFLGSTLRVRSSEEFMTMTGFCVSEYFPKLIEIASVSLISPSFKDDEIKKEVFKRMENITSIKDDAQDAMSYYFQKAYFGKHPMGNLDIGNKDSLKRLNKIKVENYFNTYYRPDSLKLAVVGNVDKKTLIDLLNKNFGKWNNPDGKKPNLEIPALPEIKGKRLLLIDKPDATQTYFILGSPGYSRNDKIETEARIIRTLFGGRFTSWLNTELRIKRGLTYGARCRMTSYKDGGIIQSLSFTQNKNIGQMLDIVFDLHSKARSEGFSATEVESARNYILGQFPPRLERGIAKAAAYIDLAYYNLGFDYYTKLLSSISKAEKPAIDKAALKLLPQDNFVLVLIGKADEIIPLLEKYGKFEVRKISAPGF